MVELRRLDLDFQVQIDSRESLLGRGPLLQIEATNISRKHARLKIGDTGDIVELTCLNKNPIHVKKGQWRDLPKDELIQLEHEDEFKFLENSFHFKVIILANNRKPSTDEDRDKLKIVKHEMAENNVQEVNNPSTSGLQATKKRKLPEWMSSTSPSLKQQRISPDKNVVTDRESKIELSGEKELILPSTDGILDVALPSTSKSPGKTRVKVDPERRKVSISPNKPGIRAHTVFPVLVTARDLLDSDEEADKENASAKKDKTADVRLSCSFGSTCYRKNPVHRVEEAHPGDDDYKDPNDEDVEPVGDDADDERPECEFGMDCYRKNPDHRKEFKHCHRPQPKRGAKKVKKVKKKKGLDEYESEDSFIDDEEENDWSPVDDSDDDENWTPKKSPELEYDE